MSPYEKRTLGEVREERREERLIDPATEPFLVVVQSLFCGLDPRLQPCRSQLCGLTRRCLVDDWNVRGDLLVLDKPVEGSQQLKQANGSRHFVRREPPLNVSFRI